MKKQKVLDFKPIAKASIEVDEGCRTVSLDNIVFVDKSGLRVKYNWDIKTEKGIKELNRAMKKHIKAGGKVLFEK